MREWSQILFNKYSDRLTNFCIFRSISANQITLFNFFFTLIVGGFFFSLGNYIGNLMGLAICVINGVLDYLDGALARATKTSLEGIWLDMAGDVILQTGIMAAIAFGIYTRGPATALFVAILLYFIVQNAMNMLSWYYNDTFGFDSHKGSWLFRQLIETKNTWVNRFFKNIIDPTSSAIGLGLFTIRYFITIGALFNIMTYCFIAVTFISLSRFIIMVIIYAFHLKESRWLFVNQVLAQLDENRKEFYGHKITDKADAL